MKQAGNEAQVQNAAAAASTLELKDPLAAAHPHKDPRQPRNGSRPQTNPPVFVGPYVDGENEYELLVSGDENFSKLALSVKTGRDPLFLSEKAFSPGIYYWKWIAGHRESSIFSFTIESEAVVLEVPGTASWIQKMGNERPRIYFRKNELESLRASRFDSRSRLWSDLRKDAEAYLKESHRIAEP